MRSKEDILEDIEMVTRKKDILLKEMEEIKEPPVETTRLEKLGFFNPKQGIDYYFIDKEEEIWRLNNSSFTSQCNVPSGNIFKTKEDARNAGHRNRIINDLLINSSKFEENKRNWCICIQNKKISLTHTHIHNIGRIYFTEEKAKEMRDKWGSDIKTIDV